MNQIELQEMQIDSDKRCSDSQLKQILSETPIIIVRSKGSKLKARVGLGDIIYIKPLKGYIQDVKLGPYVYVDLSRTDDTHYVFNYKERRFDVQIRQS